MEDIHGNFFESLTCADIVVGFIKYATLLCSFAATWMDLEMIIPSEISHKNTNIIWYHLYVESKIWYKWTYLQNRNRLTDIENKVMVTKGERRGRDNSGIWD